MLKKIVYAVMTSGLLLAPLGASAHETPFPDCYGKDCAALPHEHAEKDIVASVSESRKQTSSRKNRVEGQATSSGSPFPSAIHGSED